jgi:DNA-binding IclR family transcriptional regulator
MRDGTELRTKNSEGRGAGTRAISRATLILRLIARYEAQGIRLTQLASLTGIPHPTVRRVLKCLIDERLVVQDEDSRRYRLGPLNFELGLATLYKPEFLGPIHDVTQRVSDLCEDSTYFMVRSGSEAVCLDRIVGRSPMRIVTLEIGGRRPLGFGAAGMALLAQHPDREILEILRANDREIEVHRRVTVDGILRGVVRSRQLGYTMTRDITTMGVVSIGAVVPSRYEYSPFAVSVSSTAERMTPEQVKFVGKTLLDELRQFRDRLQWPF